MCVCWWCWRCFASYRQIAFVADLLILCPVFAALALALVRISVPDVLVRGLLFAVFALFTLKDGFRGMSPGKAAFGIRVVDRYSLTPIGAGQSFVRNLPLLVLGGLYLYVPRLTLNPIPPPIGLIVAFVGLLAIGGSLVRGPRLGDGLAHTKVVWDKYRSRPPFDLRGLFCLNCGYDLTGNVSGVCPECGIALP